MHTRIMLTMLKCMAPDNDGGGGAGDDDKPMSRKDVADLINKTVTGATKQWGERITKGITESVTKLVEGSTTPILAKLEEMAKAAPASGGENKGDGKGGVPAEFQAQLAKAEQIAKEAKEGQLAIQKQLKEKEVALEDQTINSDLTKALLDAGVRSDYTDALVLLHRATGNITMKNGVPVAKVKREGYEEDLPLVDAMKEWVKTPKGKNYLPPVDSHGTGDPKIPSNGRDAAGFAPLLTGSADDQTQAALGILAQTR